MIDTDPDGHDERVVDPRLRVRGVERLRVADGSILPFLPAINPCITTMMVAEKCADMVKEDTRAGAEAVAPSV
jgi:choline dehydrogenase